MKRAGLDYWPFVCVNVHKDWGNFLKHYDEKPPPKRLVAFTKFSSLNYALDGTYREGDMLLFGAETHGLPDGVCRSSILRDISKVCRCSPELSAMKYAIRRASFHVSTVQIADPIAK